MSFAFSCIFSSVALCLGPLSAEAAHAEQPSFETQIVKQHRISDPVFSPDGSKAAFVVSEPSDGKKRHASIWLFETGAGKARKLTAGPNDSRPRWSPDGRALAFISKRGDAKSQVYLLPMNGGEADPVTDAKGGVTTFEWSPTGSSLAYLTQDPAPTVSDEDTGDDEVVASEGYQPNRLMIRDLTARTDRRLLEADHWAVAMFSWTPDGQGMVVSATDKFEPEGVINRLFLVSSGGAVREIGQMHGVEFANLKTSPDGRSVAYVASGDGPMPHDLYVQPISGGPARNLTGKGSLANIDRPVVDVVWTARDTIGFTTQHGFGSEVHSVSVSDGRASVQKRFKDHALGAWSASGPRMIYVKSSAVDPGEVWVLANGREQMVTSLHAGFPQLVAPRLITYPGADGVEIEAALFTPQGVSSPMPLVVLAHGGPTGRWSHSVNDWAQLLVREGVAVLAPNIRGSVGYGYDFVKSIRADWGGGDFRDILAGVDHVIAEGVADPDRLAIGGWSYGGYMSAWAVTQTQRFKAAVVGAAMLDLRTQWGAEEAEIIPYDTWYIGTPWDSPETFERLSPITHVKNVTTPTLLLVGEDDTVDPVVQNWQFFRALRMNGVKSELVLYPREGHRITEEAHVRDLHQRMTRWLVDHVKAK